MSLDEAQDNNSAEVQLQPAEQDRNVSVAQENDTAQENGANPDLIPSKTLVEGVECSLTSTERFTVRFVNTTDKTIDVIWLDFAGQQVKYHTLTPHTAWSVFTYKVCVGSFHSSNFLMMRLGIHN